MRWAACFFLWALSVQAQLWVVGETFVGSFSDSFRLRLSGKTQGAALDSQGNLWASVGGRLVEFRPHEISHPLGFDATVLGISGSLLLLKHREELWLFDVEARQIKERLARPWLETAQKAMLVGDRVWVLHQDKSGVWVEGLDEDWNPIQQIPVVSRPSLGPLRWHRDRRNNVWVGLTLGQTSPPYSPYVVQLAPSGRQLFEQSWNEQGIFFGFGQWPSGEMGVLREQPTPPLSLPWVPFIDRAQGLQPFKTWYRGENNWVITAAHMESSSFWIAETNSQGSDRSRLSRVLLSGEKESYALEGKVLKLFAQK